MLRISNGGEVMNGVLKGIIIGIVVMYVISPVDLLPGMPFDDLVAIVLGAISIMNKPKEAF